MHEHHHCECKHETIRFCKRCQRPYCADCGQEWFDKCTQSHYYPWYCGSTYTTTPLTDTIITSGANTAHNTDDCSTVTNVGCSHGYV